MTDPTGSPLDLVAVHDVTRTVYELADGIDMRDWGRYRGIFTDEVVVDDESHHGRPATRRPADDWVATVRRLFDGLDATQHSPSNPILGPDGDGARCRVSMEAAHVLDDGAGDRPEFTFGGY